jgi:transcriptional regulator with XRE-family HTH domain
MPDEGFATRLKRLRHKHGVSQVKLAKSLKVSKLSVWKWERREVIPRPATVQALADMFGVSEHYLLIGSEDEEPAGLAQAKGAELGTASLEVLIADCKRRIATYLGTTPDKIGITVDR